MPSVDVVDETFLAVPPEVVAAEFAVPARWVRWWPDLRLAVDTDRGVQGFRWTVTGALVGSMEVWLEPVLDGT
ncbi:polyketide cyclase / dehydrase and lipid transport, partial [Pseudonocardia sp. KRD-182]|nr:polyketide cyclase / dehydrase and lipid transport [Pseudonocardia oceani]